jgi:hypothetical protein
MTTITAADMEQALKALLDKGAEPAADRDLERTKLLSIQQFCVWANISPSQYYKLEKDGRGPAVIVLSRMGRRISMAEAEAWASRLSHPTGKEAAFQQRERERCRASCVTAGRAAAAGPAGGILPESPTGPLPSKKPTIRCAGCIF